MAPPIPESASSNMRTDPPSTLARVSLRTSIIRESSPEGERTVEETARRISAPQVHPPHLHLAVAKVGRSPMVTFHLKVRAELAVQPGHLRIVLRPVGSQFIPQSGPAAFPPGPRHIREVHPL